MKKTQTKQKRKQKNRHHLFASWPQHFVHITSYVLSFEMVREDSSWMLNPSLYKPRKYLGACILHSFSSGVSWNRACHAEKNFSAVKEGRVWWEVSKIVDVDGTSSGSAQWMDTLSKMTTFLICSASIWSCVVALLCSLSTKVSMWAVL